MDALGGSCAGKGNSVGNKKNLGGSEEAAQWERLSPRAAETVLEWHNQTPFAETGKHQNFPGGEVALTGNILC